MLVNRNRSTTNAEQQNLNLETAYCLGTQIVTEIFLALAVSYASASLLVGAADLQT